VDQGLLFFHERRADGSYTINLALLDETTGRVLSRLPEPVFEPELDWECWGDVDNVVFVQGAHCDGDDVYLTYGAADRCVGVATARVGHLLDALRAGASGATQMRHWESRERESSLTSPERPSRQHA
jgi:predicted GH43/DUF377 family glycosyl hydrolase